LGGLDKDDVGIESVLTEPIWEVAGEGEKRAIFEPQQDTFTHPYSLKRPSGASSGVPGSVVQE